jgi:hypothetical protein
MLLASIHPKPVQKLRLLSEACIVASECVRTKELATALEAAPLHHQDRLMGSAVLVL